MGKFLKEGSISHRVLMILKELLEIGVELLIWDYESLRKRAGFGPLYRMPRPLFYRGLRNLKRDKFIRVKITQQGKEIQLTKKGRIEIMKYKIKFKTKKPKWDGKWYAICWDVPEISRADRDFLRYLLRWLGFKELQKSLWVFPYPIKDELGELIRLCREKLAGDIRFLTIEKIEDDSDLREYFHFK